MQAKIDYIEQNAKRPQPNQWPTVITEDEVTDYLIPGRVQIPKGVNKVTLQGRTPSSLKVHRLLLSQS
jgi:hypothetical protein